MTQAFRLPDGGLVDRAAPLGFTWDGVRFDGCTGDTLASALLANGIHLVGRSFKYHRPRGIVSAGAEEPNALVQLALGARTEPNARATQVELCEGLAAASQNCWPSVRFDVGAINNALSGLFPSGFYYKTFMWPPSPRWWLKYEHVIRHAAGMGRGATAPDPDHYEHQYAHCDVLVIGAGPAGLAAARAAAHSGARVILCDEGPQPGGSLLGEPDAIDGAPAANWIAAVLRELAERSDFVLLSRATAFGCYDGNLVGVIEHVADRMPAPPAHVPRQRLWKIRAQLIVLASGAHERAIAYANNDLPGTLLAGAARATYAALGQVQFDYFALDIKGLLVCGAHGSHDPVVWKFHLAALQPFLQFGLRVLADRGHRRIDFDRLEQPLHQRLRSQKATVQIDRADHRLQRVGQYRRTLAASRAHLAVSQTDRIGQAQFDGQLVQGFLLDQVSAHP